MALRFRQAARALLLDPDDRVLLVRFEFPAASFWALPGGGLDDGEEVEAGLRRELHEELGLTEFVLGPHIWNREHVIPMETGHDGQQDRIHLVRVDHFDPVPTIGWEQLRAEHVHQIRWWSPEELVEVPTDLEFGPGEIRFAPRRLAGLVRDLIEVGPPTRPIDTGV